MNEESLRQAILAIAVNIDYKRSDWESNIRGELPAQQMGDPAFYVLDTAIIADFKKAYREGIPISEAMKLSTRKAEGPSVGTTALAVIGQGDKGIPPLRIIFEDTFSAMFAYVAMVLNWSDYNIPYSSTVEMLNSRRHRILVRFVQSSRADMFVELASRECVYEAIRNHLYKNNNQRTQKMYNILRGSNRPQVVFDMFKAHFRARSATAFQFRGSFLDFLMHTYQNHFYGSIYKPEIWQALKEQDLAKAEHDFDIKKVVETATDTTPDDIYIHRWLQFIGEANIKLYRHTGTGDANGVMYDLVYRILMYLCEEKAKQLNKRLKDYSIQIVDPYSRARGKRANKNIYAKINNARELIPFLFEYIRSGNVSSSRTLDMKREAFKYGRSDTQGKNPVWRSEGRISEGDTSCYLDTSDGSYNHEAFDIILRGVASAYSLLNAMNSRGMNLVEEYLNSRGYKDESGSTVEFSAYFMIASVYRQMDYLSSMKYLPLMMQLQREGAAEFAVEDKQRGKEGDADLGLGELHDFDGMVYDYAGSPLHTVEHLTKNREYAMSRGLLDKPRLKSRANLTTTYEKRRSCRDYMACIPYTFEEFRDRRRTLLWTQQLSKNEIVRYASLDLAIADHSWGGPEEDDKNHVILRANGEFSAMEYTSFAHNSVLQGNMPYAREHLSEKALLSDISWHIGTHEFGGVYLPRAINQGLTPVTQIDGSVRQVPTIYKFYTNYIHIPFAGYMCTTFFDQDGNLTCNAFSGNDELTWLGDRPGRMYCQLPMMYDPHTVALAGGLKDKANGLPLNKAEDFTQEVIAKSQERLKRSLGFPIYIGIENLDSPEVRKALDSVEVWPEYAEQMRTYYAQLQELNWMQETYVILLESIFQLCWFITYPGYHAPVEDAAHARSLFNSLLSGVFKREDLLWFFSYLEASYVDQNGPLPQNRWPQRLKRFHYGGMNPHEKRETIQPLWALMLSGPFRGWKETMGLEPPTQFEEGPYTKFLESITRVEDVCEQFVLLHAFLNQKTLYIKTLRDAFVLTFNQMGEDNSSLGCEFYTVFNIRKLFNPNSDSWGQGSASLRGGTVDMSEYIINQVIQDNITFEVLRTALDDHYAECRNDLQKMVNYDVAVDDDLTSKFAKWSDALLLIPPITNSMVLDTIRGSYVCDTHKFFYSGSDYFKVPYGPDTLYLHYSGNFLRKASNGEYEAFVLPHETSAEVSRYDSLLREGMGNAHKAD